MKTKLYKNNNRYTTYFTLGSIKIKRYKTVCAELSFAKVTFDKLTMILYGLL